MSSHSILGFDGGQALGLSDNVLHIRIDDMQIAEDAQVIIGHLMMQWLCGFAHDEL
jgi:D-sedoheptulose 7-phosphate isomerase